MQDFESIVEKLDRIEKRYNKLCDYLEYEEVFLDKKLFLKIDSERVSLLPLMEDYFKVKELKEDIFVYEELILEEKRDKKRQAYLTELENSKDKLKELENKLLLTYQKIGANLEEIVVEVWSKSYNNLLVDIVSGYQKYCRLHDFECEADIGHTSIRLTIFGLNAKKIFDEERGIHLDNLGKQVLVFVYDNIKLKEFKEEDIKINICRSSGAGGQHVNTTDSAVKITHIPTKITASSQEERSQLQNKNRALENLKQKVAVFYQDEINTHFERQKKVQLDLVKNTKVKFYDYSKGEINCKNKIINLKDFLEGKSL